MSRPSATTRATIAATVRQAIRSRIVNAHRGVRGQPRAGVLEQPRVLGLVCWRVIGTCRCGGGISRRFADRYGYRDFTTQPDRFAFTAWLVRQAWHDDPAPSVLFRAAHRQLLARQILLPGHACSRG